MAERHDSRGADRVKHRKRIRASLCHRRQRIDRVGQPRAPLVEADHACHPRQLKDERPVRCVLPFQIQGRDQARDEQQVNQPTSANLKRNVSVAATRVPGLQLHILHYHIPPARRNLARRPVRPAPLAPAATAPSASSPSRPCWSPRSASTFASSAPRRKDLVRIEGVRGSNPLSSTEKLQFRWPVRGSWRRPSGPAHSARASYWGAALRSTPSITTSMAKRNRSSTSPATS